MLSTYDSINSLFQNLDAELQHAVQYYWDSRDSALGRKKAAGRQDAGMRGAATFGGQMAALEVLVRHALKLVGLPGLDIKIGRSDDPSSNGRLEIPGYYRPEKKWDMLVLSI